jgi:peroxiredoxin|tara:strand:+ start:1447 stop:1590 length:144 start_codon:yes stop_codon:yes gene_type:complete
MVAVGDRFPAVIAQSHEPSWPTPVKMQDRLKGKKTLVVGLPGAFTPT